MSQGFLFWEAQTLEDGVVFDATPGLVKSVAEVVSDSAAGE